MPKGVIELVIADSEKIYIAVVHITSLWPHYDGSTYINSSLRLSNGHEHIIFEPVATILDKWDKA